MKWNDYSKPGSKSGTGYQNVFDVKPKGTSLSPAERSDYRQSERNYAQHGVSTVPGWCRNSRTYPTTRNLQQRIHA